MLLIVGQEADPHVSSVRDILNKYTDLRVELLNIYDPINLAYHPSNMKKEGLNFADDIDYIWWRGKPKIRKDDFCPSDPIEENHFYGEWDVFLHNISIEVDEKRQLSALPILWRASNKLFQLRVAEKIGFHIPATIVSNDANEVVKEFDESILVYKQLSSHPAGEKGALATTEVSKPQIIENAAELHRCVGLFQERIKKKEEWRIVVFGDEVFAQVQTVRADSHIDWRTLSTEECSLDIGQVDTKLTDMLRNFLSEMGLVHGVFDIAKDENNKFVFLECNPGGQYHGLQLRHNLNLSGAMANLILKERAKYV